MKKILIVLISLILIAFIALSGWYLLFKSPNTPVAETIKNILPFGSAPTSSGVGVPTSSPTGASEGTEARSTSNLFRISAEPVAGAVVLKATIVRYVDRATGHIYDTDLVTMVTTKVTNQTLPKIYEAYFKEDGNSVLLRSLREDSDMIDNLVWTLTPPKAGALDTLYSATSTRLQGKIGSVAVGSGNALFYTMEDTSSIMTSAFNGAGAKKLLNSSFKDWRVASAANTLIVYTKASRDVSGYAYTLNTLNESLTKLLGPLNALTLIPNTANNRVLYSYVESGKTKTFAKNLKTNALSEIVPSTLAEKCVWSVKNTDLVFCGAPTEDWDKGEPDNWYRGLTHFSDHIWLFDTKVNIARVLVEPKSVLDQDIDAVELKLSANEDYLVFINKNDLSLWALRLVDSI